MAHGCPEDDCPTIERRLSELKQELDEKHRQNRGDIHTLRNEQQAMLLLQARLEEKMKPILGNGKPGMLDRFSMQLEELGAALQGLREQRAAEAGVKRFLQWALPLGVGAIALGVPLLVVVLQHMWK